jgi:DNA polymerase III delta prime subunit
LVSDYQIIQQVYGNGNLVTGTGDIYVYRLPDAPSARDRWLLDDLLDKTERLWLHPFLDPLGLVSLMPALDARQDLVASPLAQTLEMEQSLGRTYQPPQGTASLGEIFLGVGRALLILGDPGAGKTIALLKLARSLVERARTDPAKTEPVPLILPLGSWSPHSQGLRDWAARQIAQFYLVAEGGRLLDEGRLLLLLDGLDEVAEEHQGYCTRAINHFIQTSGCPGIALCCRLQDYLNLIGRDADSRLCFYAAINLRPLTEEQIDQYLKGQGARLAALRDSLDHNADLLALARTPLMLTIMVAALSNQEGVFLAGAGAGEADSHHAWLFDAYLERMLARMPKGQRLPPTPKLLAWLGWLARETRLQQQPLLLLEHLQPAWLELRRDRWLYFALSRLLAGLVFGTIIALTEWLQPPGSSRPIDINLGLLGLGALLGTGAGLVMGLIDALRMGDGPIYPHHGVRTSLAALGFAGLYAPLWGGVAWSLTQGAGPAVSAGEAIEWALIAGAFFATRTTSSLKTDIHLPELLRWSWPGLGRGLIKGAVAGAFLAVIVVLAACLTQAHDVPETGLFYMWMLAAGGLLGSWAGGFFGAFQGEALSQRLVPGQGIRATLTGSGWVLLSTALTLGLLAGGGTAQLYDPDYGLGLGLILGTCLGAASALWYGGLALIRHGVLRLVLAGTGQAPLSYVRFLNQACHMIVLRRIGGSYQFVHDLLRAHLARRAPIRDGATPPR